VRRSRVPHDRRRRPRSTGTGSRRSCARSSIACAAGDVDVSLVEIPEPILHPDGILVYTELQIDARKDEACESITHRRLAVFRQGRDRSWRIAALSPV
jgi:hypothetical protein